MKNFMTVASSVIALSAIQLPALAIFDGAEVDGCAASIDGSSLAEVSQKLANCGGSEMQRARSAFTWTAKHIAYDAHALQTGEYRNKDYSAPAVFSSRLAVCEGYANVFQALATNMGLSSTKISGQAKGKPGVDSGHAWNAVKIDGAWRLIDTTWGAGGVDSNFRFSWAFNTNYFASGPQFFRMTHFPSDAGWQLVSPTIDYNQFMAQPIIGTSAKAADLGVELIEVRRIESNLVQVMVKFHQPVWLQANSDSIAAYSEEGSGLMQRLPQDSRVHYSGGTAQFGFLNLNQQHQWIYVSNDQSGNADGVLFGKTP